MKLSRNKLVLSLMMVITLVAIGGVALAYSQGTPVFAVLVSFASLALNLVARFNIITT